MRSPPLERTKGVQKKIYWPVQPLKVAGNQASGAPNNFEKNRLMWRQMQVHSDQRGQDGSRSVNRMMGGLLARQR